MGLSLQCFIPSFVEIGSLVLGKNIVFFAIYGRGSHLGHMTSTMLMAYIQNLVENGPVVSEKRKFVFPYVNDLRPRSKRTLTLNNHISSLT